MHELQISTLLLFSLIISILLETHTLLKKVWMNNNCLMHWSQTVHLEMCKAIKYAYFFKTKKNLWHYLLIPTKEGVNTPDLPVMYTESIPSKGSVSVGFVWQWLLILFHCWCVLLDIVFIKSKFFCSLKKLWKNYETDL